jgi:hypothetical protein
MIATSSHDKTATDGHGSLLVLGVLSAIVGVGAGLVGAAFRMSLAGADRARNTLISWAHGSQWSGPGLERSQPEPSADLLAEARWPVRNRRHFGPISLPLSS